jgi:hypothetical protein
MRLSDLHRRILSQVERRYIATFNTALTSAGSSASNQLALPLLSTGGTYNFTVEWGDGTSDLITSGTQAERIHTYASAGVYDIKISGQLIGWRFNNTGDRLKLLNIKNWGKSVEYTDITGIYQGCANMDFSAIDVPILLGSLVTFFNNCSSLIGNSSINNWNVSNVTNFSSMFNSATVFNQDISSWNVGSGTTFTDMFRSATNFNQDIGSWDVSNGNIFAGMFRSATNFNQDIGSWDVGSATGFNAMFLLATNFNQDISSWNVGSGTNFNQMFDLASTFNQNIGAWNVGNGTNFSAMFRNATAFDQDLGSWNMSKASNLTNFMASKTAANYSAANLDSIYNGWSALTFVNTGLTISFNTIKYTAAGQAGRDILTGAPNNWNITDGGI